MFNVNRTEIFSNWLASLRDPIGKSRILARLNRLSQGNWGDHEPVGDGVIELRIDTGPGYRVYCWRSGELIIIALAGGDKSTQQRDIDRAKEMVRQLKSG